ncbi:MAG: SDR family NAD(P)-dependent oxidoreductase [Desulfobacteraceae bacterium]
MTGAGGGAGRSIVFVFARNVADVAVNDINAETVEATAVEMRKLGRKALANLCDVTTQPNVIDMVGKVDDKKSRFVNKSL